MRPKLKEVGVFLIHLGIVFILFGAIISASFSQKYIFNIPIYENEILDTGMGGIGIKILKLKESSGPSPEIPISKIKENPIGYLAKDLQISGKVVQELNVGNYRYIELNDSTESIWVALPSSIEVKPGMDLTAFGFLMLDFWSPTLEKTFDIILFSDNIQPIERTISKESIELEVYRHGKMVGKGTAEFIEGKEGSVTHPIVDRSLIGDVYIIFQGTSQGIVPLTLEFKPAINQVWIGVGMFTLGIVIIMGIGLRRKNEEC